MKIIHIQRRRPPERFSIEGYFERVRACLSPHVDIRLYSLPFFSRGLFRRAANTIFAAARRADVYHITGDVHYVAMLLPRSRTLLTVHDCEILARKKGWKRWLIKLLWYTIPARRVNYITVNSEETRKSLLSVVDYPMERIKVIPVSVSAAHVPVPKPFCSERPRILQIGTKKNKNLIRLAAALEGFSCELHVIGPMTEEQRTCFARHGVAYENHLHISDEDLIRQYRLADIISFVSTHEGFGMPIIEAQWTERVCVTSNCSSMPEVAGDGACFVDPFDVESIRGGFTRVTRDADYRHDLLAKGRVNRIRFNAEQIAGEFQNVYNLMEQELTAC